MDKTLSVAQHTCARKRERTTPLHHQHHRRPRRPRTNGVPPTPPPSKVCSVCDTGAPNYKCPKCRSIYCSAACCKLHKQKFCESVLNEQRLSSVDIPDGTPNGTTPPTAPNVVGRRSKYLSNEELMKLQASTRTSKNRSRDYTDDENLEEGWEMTNDMINNIRQSTWLRQELKDEGLQVWITSLAATSKNVIGRRKGDTTTAQEAFLAESRGNNPAIRLFLDKLLLLAGVLERPTSDGASLNACLEATDLGLLRLRSLSQRRRNQDTSAKNNGTESSTSTDDSNSSDSSGEDDELTAVS